MEQAIRDSGLEPSDVSNERTGIIMGSGGPSTRTIVEGADIARSKGPKRVGPFAVPKAMSSTASATLATWFKIKGVNYSISSACATSNHCIGNAYETIQWGKQDIVFAGGSEELDWTLSVFFDAMGAMSSKYNDTPSVASRAYDVNRDGFVIACWCWKNSNMRRRAARAFTARSSATARPRTATTWWRRRARAPSAA
jgi:3-oxoacyl-[acyl-carrier-protein] synthase-1